MRYKVIFASLVLALIGFVSLAKSADAGGCCIGPPTLVKNGVAGGEPAVVSGVVANPEYNPTTNPSVYKIGEVVEVKVENAYAGQYCDTAVSGSEGKFQSNCYSPYSGSMRVYFIAPNMIIPPGTGILTKSIWSTVVEFSGNNPPPAKVAPVATILPKPTATTIPAPQATKSEPVAVENEENTQQIEDLEAKTKQLEEQLAAQQEELNRQKTIIVRLQELLSNLLGRFSSLFQ